jgi:hypothetical protein
MTDKQLREADERLAAAVRELMDRLDSIREGGSIAPSIDWDNDAAQFMADHGRELLSALPVADEKVREVATELADTFAEFAEKAKLPPGDGYSSREIGVSLWDQCSDGGESIDDFGITPDEAELIANALRALSARVQPAPSGEAEPPTHPIGHASPPAPD